MPASDFLAFNPASSADVPTTEPSLPEFNFTGSLMDRASRRGTLMGDIDQRTQRILAGQASDEPVLEAGRYRLSQAEGEQALAAARRRASVAETDAHYQRLTNGEDLLHRAALEAPQLAARLDAETDPAAIESHAADFLSRYAQVAGAPEFGARFDRLAAPISHLVATKPAALRQRYAAAARGLWPMLEPDDPESLVRIEAAPFFEVARRDPEFAQALIAAKRRRGADIFPRTGLSLSLDPNPETDRLVPEAGLQDIIASQDFGVGDTVDQSSDQEAPISEARENLDRSPEPLPAGQPSKPLPADQPPQNDLPTWSDYRGKRPAGAFFSGNTKVGLDLSELEVAPVTLEGNFATLRLKTPIVRAKFDPDGSWLHEVIDPDSPQGRQLLDHERGHVLIARQVAAEMSKDLQHFSVTVEGASRRDATGLAIEEGNVRLKEKYDFYDTLLRERQKEYDLATKNGSNKISQEEWSKKLKP